MIKQILVISKRKLLNDIKELLAQSNYELCYVSDEKQIVKKLKDAAVIFIDESFESKNNVLRERIISSIHAEQKPFIVIGNKCDTALLDKAMALGAADYIIRPYNFREFLKRLNAVVDKQVRITCIGGGTGLFTLLLGIKAIPNTLLTSIVSMSDDGGSSGKLKTDFGVLPPGDIRRSLVALSNAPEFVNDVMQFRFKKGSGLSGHSFGNLFLTALAEIKGSMSEAIRNLGDILNLQGVVLPVTTMRTTLCAQFEEGSVLKGESKIDVSSAHLGSYHIQNIWHEPKVDMAIDSYSSLINSDIICIGPGDLFTSVITNFLVNGCKEAITKSKATKIYVCNLMTKPGETFDFDVYQHVQQIVKFLGGDYLDYVLVSDSRLSQKAINEYSRKKQKPVKISSSTKIHNLTKAKVVVADIGHETQLVRHDSVKLKREFIKIVKKVKAQKQKSDV